jgi:nucleotide-binding universal stress UspA family protein
MMSMRGSLSRVTAANTRRRDRDTDRLLVVVDSTDASRRALQYVGRMLARRQRVSCHLAYIGSGLPPELLESGGSESPDREEQIEADLRLAQRRWAAASNKNANRILRAARTTLRRAGIAAARIHVCSPPPLDAGTPVHDVVVRLAREEACQTIVVGHQAHSWLRGLGGGHLAEQLVRQAKGLTVWVVD